MKFDPHDFITIEKGRYFIGLTKEAIKSCSGRIKNSPVKMEFLVNSSPEHEVLLDGCSISKGLVTLSQFEKFIGKSGYVTEAESDGWGWIWEEGWQKRESVNWRTPFGNSHDGLYEEMKELVPVLQLSWNDSNAYCRWLSEIAGRSIGIPGEGEWEIFSRSRRGKGIQEICEGWNESIVHPVPTEEYFFHEAERSNRCFGTGILWEWTSDWFEAYPGGEGSRDFGKIYKVLRGGSYMSHPLQRSREYRFRRCPTARSPFYGLRIMVRGGL